VLIHQSADSVSNTYHTIRYSNFRCRMHFHRGYELIHVMRGQIELTVDDRVELLDTGDFACLMSNQPHRVQTVGDSFVWICCFSPDYFPEFHKTVRGKVGAVSRFSCDPTILDFLHKNVLFSETYGGRKQDPFQLKGALHLLCGDYLRSTTLEKRDNTQYKLMNTISDYVAENYHRKLNMQEIAESLGYEYSYFSRVFRGVFGVSFPELLNSYRCSAAVEMIRDTDESISSIAEKSGFQSIRTFNSVFQKQMGMSPTEYMNQLKSAPRRSGKTGTSIRL